MKRSEMICENCIKSAGVESFRKEETQVLCKEGPEMIKKAPNDWCGRGAWIGEATLLLTGEKELARFFWGEWLVDDVAEPEARRKITNFVAAS